MCSTPGAAAAAAAAAAELPPAAAVEPGRESWAMQFSRSRSHMYTHSAQQGGWCDDRAQRKGPDGHVANPEPACSTTACSRLLTLECQSSPMTPHATQCPYSALTRAAPARRKQGRVARAPVIHCWPQPSCTSRRHQHRLPRGRQTLLPALGVVAPDAHRAVCCAGHQQAVVQLVQLQGRSGKKTKVRLLQQTGQAISRPLCSLS